MDIFVCNCHGVCSCGFVNLIKYISKKYQTSLLFLFETYACKIAANCILPRLGFNGYFIQEACGHLRGIWL